MKSKIKNPRFDVVRKGYDVDAVEAYIKQETNKAEEVQASQRERILELDAQIDSLQSRLDDYVNRETQITSAIISATEKADKMTADVQLRYTMELERLNAFRAKWIGVYNELKSRYHFDKDALNMESVAVSTKLEIERILSQDFSLVVGDRGSDSEDDFKREVERLAKYDGAVLELRDKLLKASAKKEQKQTHDAAFSV